MGVSKNNGTPESSILTGVSIIFTIHFGVPLIFGNSQMCFQTNTAGKRPTEHDFDQETCTHPGHWMPEEAIVKPQVPKGGKHGVKGIFFR